MKTDEMGEACSKHGWDEKCLQNFSRNTYLEDLSLGDMINIFFP